MHNVYMKSWAGGFLGGQVIIYGAYPPRQPEFKKMSNPDNIVICKSKHIKIILFIKFTC